MCELLVSEGHNTSYRDPYQYSLPKLDALHSIVTDRIKSNLASSSLIHHVSRISIAAADSKIFTETLEKLEPDHG